MLRDEEKIPVQKMSVGNRRQILKDMRNHAPAKQNYDANHE
jgi:hypothetical protein